MEHHHHSHNPHTNVLLSINITCCEKCPKLLEKKLLNMKGVNSVAIYLEENLVSVTGVMDPITLLNDVAALGKSVKLVPNDKNPNNQNEQQFEDFIHKDTQKEGQPSSSQQFTSAPKKEKMGKKCSCQDGRHSVKKEKEHKLEAYVPKEVDPRVCRDYYCKDHQKMRDIANRVSLEDSFFGGFPLSREFGSSPNYEDPYFYQGMPQQFGYYGPRGPFGFR